jgi:ADP-ribosylglycohydrolase/catechol 2,3-dioxygenase-like lactoylglutathione lyase family enzyme
MVAAAVGDALGWPQELRSSIVGGQKARSVPPQARFRQWDRNSGNQFGRYRETIEAGEYSDDTQLLMVVARCCLAGNRWQELLTEVELPAWTLYQRGAGRAVIAAARSWAGGRPPWLARTSKDDRNKADPIAAYFNAGANGVAMRVAPHAIVTAERDPRELITRVIADGIATHGHPRALVGAVIHALALRHALLREGTLEYGNLVQALLDDQCWQEPDFLDAVLPKSWIRTFIEVTGNHPVSGWISAVHEVIDLLIIAHRALAKGALANDELTLGELGCYDKDRNGSGTVTAVAATYIATRSAARPMTGLLRSAFLPKADTDTLASMTGSLLGAIHGTGWLELLAEGVQDADYIQYLGTRLANASASSAESIDEGLFSFSSSSEFPRVRVDDLSRYRNLLFTADQLTGRRFLDGRKITAGQRSIIPASGRNIVARAYLRLEDGQSLIIDKLQRRNPEELGHPTLWTSSRAEPHDVDKPSATIRGVTFRVADVKRSLSFYRDVLNLPVEHTSDMSFRLPNGLIFSEFPGQDEPATQVQTSNDVVIIIEVNNFADVAKRLQALPIEAEDIENWHERSPLRMRDPDGNTLEIMQR